MAHGPQAPGMPATPYPSVSPSDAIPSPVDQPVARTGLRGGAGAALELAGWRTRYLAKVSRKVLGKLDLLG